LWGGWCPAAEVSMERERERGRKGRGDERRKKMRVF
jgi:hypothetical protein